MSETSVKSGDKNVPEEEDDEEDLPEVPFSRVLALNKPELPYIISKSSHYNNFLLLRTTSSVIRFDLYIRYA